MKECVHVVEDEVSLVARKQTPRTGGEVGTLFLITFYKSIFIQGL